MELRNALDLDKNFDTIILCPKCGGNGFTVFSELTDYHRREYSHTKEKCKVCEGSGRILQTTTLHHIPFKEPIL